MSDKATVNVTDVVPEARLIRADQIREELSEHGLPTKLPDTHRWATPDEVEEILADPRVDHLVVWVGPDEEADVAVRKASPFTVEGAAIATAFEDSVQIDHLTSDQLDEVDSILTKAGY